MADSIKAAITQNLKDRLETLQTYPNKATPTVELERTVLSIGDRYPYIMLCGPWSEAEDEITLNTQDKLTYIIKYYVDKNDENANENTELPYLTRNVAADIIKHIMNDVSRGQRAQKTEKTGNGYAYDLSNEEQWEFYVYVIIEVTVFIHKLNPYNLG